MKKLMEFLSQEGVSRKLLDRVTEYRKTYDVMEIPEETSRRIPQSEVRYYGTGVWEKAIAALLSGENLLLAGPKATGKNVLAENLAELFGRPLWDVSFHVNVDASYLIGTDTYDGSRVTFRPGPVYNCAVYGGFGVLDEINMARNEALAVLHATLDFRHVIDVAGYDRIPVSPAARFIGTMNYGYAGTRDLNEALCSRFAILDMPLIGEGDLQRLLKDVFPAIKPKICQQFVHLFYEIERKAQAAEISERALDLRGLIDAIRLVEKGIRSGDALEMCIVNKTFDAYERRLVTDVINSRIPTDLKREDVFEETAGQGE
ncbi:MAG TPA: nitric-oxide reductase [Lachnospiraceae bacterium]|jgi:nitric oxide reductase NorQ protein|nr:nitric-oxide reductase [Lachnospiraceae bacterium]HCI83166.1 nitric-oxide reductase [Lachnospiraceae bacterium]